MNSSPKINTGLLKKSLKEPNFLKMCQMHANFEVQLWVWFLWWIHILHFNKVCVKFPYIVTSSVFLLSYWLSDSVQSDNIAYEWSRVAWRTGEVDWWVKSDGKGLRTSIIINQKGAAWFQVWWLILCNLSAAGLVKQRFLGTHLDIGLVRTYIRIHERGLLLKNP